MQGWHGRVEIWLTECHIVLHLGNGRNSLKNYFGRRKGIFWTSHGCFSNVARRTSGRRSEICRKSQRDFAEDAAVIGDFRSEKMVIFGRKIGIFGQGAKERKTKLVDCQYVAKIAIFLRFHGFVARISPQKGQNCEFP